MRKRKMVYICDYCGAIALERYYYCGRSKKGPPNTWRKVGKQDICPKCWEIYKKFKREIAEGGNDD